jgi:integral membrane protein (TIGR00529 family)
MEALKLGLILIAIIAALRRRVSVGVTLLAMGPLTALLYQVPIRPLLNAYKTVAGSQHFISLTALVVIITIMGSLLKVLGHLDRLAGACQTLYGGARTAAVVLPPLVGLMPMPGGSLLSAPLIDSILKHPRYTPHFKCALNYWFRHLVEFTWPVYAGILLTAALTQMSIAHVSLLQAPFSLVMLLIGLVYFTRRIQSEPVDNPSLWKPLKGIIGSIWPVAVAILLYAIAGLNLAISALLALVVLVAVARPSQTALIESIKEGLSPKLLILIYGVLTFQKILDLSGGVQSIPRLATDYGLPEELIIVTVCFMIGLLTGMVSAYVGLGYSLLSGLLYQPVLNPGYIMLASMSGFAGMMLSPAHLCLVVTNEYFGSDILKVMRTLALPLVLFTLIGYGLYVLGYGRLFLQ